MKYRIPLIAGALAAATSVSLAQVVFTENFDAAVGTPANYGAGPGSVTYSSSAPVASGQAIRFDMPFDEWGNDRAYQLQLGTLAANTSASLNDYVLSYDLYQTGISSLTPGVQLRIEGWADDWFGGAMTGTGSGYLALPAAGEWQSFSVNLGTTLPLGNFNPTSNTWQIIVNPKSWEIGGPVAPGSYTLLIDNVSLTQVPEPSAYAALAGLAGLGAVCVRRRRV